MDHKDIWFGNRYFGYVFKPVVLDHVYDMENYKDTRKLRKR